MADIQVSDKEIVEYVRILSFSFGIRKSISEPTLSKIKSSYESRLISECIGEIKLIFGLNLTLLVGLIKSKPTYAGMLKLIEEKVFHIYGARSNLSPNALEKLRDLTNTNAFILQPSNMPSYGSKAFDDLKILLFVFKWITEQPFETFAYCIAHELSHIVLDAVHHPLRNNEVAVDLTTMILGFSDIFLTGRVGDNRRYGYLEDDQFRLAYEEIQRRSGIICL